LVLAGAGLAAGLLLSSARSDPPPEAPAHDHPPGGPPPVAPWAIPSNTPAYIGYYVGGGCPYPHLGDGRQPQEGTWGWDFAGRCFWRKVDLLWWHGRRYQGGTGAYKTDGPRPLQRLHQAGDDWQ
jgi:hypothetical protein